jgi:alkylated DNA repair dioxygenase AlkB
MATHGSPLPQGELVAVEPRTPAGFAYRDDLISPAEEQVVLRELEKLPFKPFEFRGFVGKRHVASFGWRYDYAGAALREATSVPAFLLALRERAADFGGVAAGDLEQILVNRYASGAGIGWHRDKPMFDTVIAISLAGPSRLRLRRRQADGWERVSQDLAPRSGYRLQGPSRWEWQHSLAEVEALRYSVTFRNFVPEFVREPKGIEPDAI